MADPGDRLRKIERLLVIQGKIHRLAEWRLAALDRKRDEVAADRAGLVAALNEDRSLQGLFVDAMARRLTILARETDRLARAREAQHRRLTEEGLRLKRFERATGKAHRHSQELGRRRGFQAILDALSTTDDASLP
jgi:hypothetical protein